MIAVVGGTLIDGTDRRPGGQVPVAVEGDGVATVGPAGATPVPPSAAVIDARNRFLTPGLVDMHVHVYTPDKWHPELFLAAGVTTVLDLGGQLHDVAGYRRAVESGARDPPRAGDPSPPAGCGRKPIHILASPVSAGGSTRRGRRPRSMLSPTRAWTASSSTSRCV